MRALRITLLLFFVASPAAHAAGDSIVSREVPLGSMRSPAAVSAPRVFDMVGLHWRGGGSVTFRTRSVGGRWSAWHPAEPEPEDAPDVGAEPSRRGWRLGNPWWSGPSDRLEVRARGSVRRVRAWFVFTAFARVPLRHVSVAGSPPVISRAGWKADERIVRKAPKYAPQLWGAVVHHTAGRNTYRPEESAAIVRGIELYHVKANGWNDIGYNFLVDRYGQVFEGRAGGMARNVIGAHAQGFNTGFTGVALIGTYSSKNPSPAAERALGNLLAWRLDAGHVDPTSSAMIPSGGNSRFTTGTPVLLGAISGHRDTGYSACPGDRLYNRLAALVEVAATTGLPKLYEPRSRGAIGKTVRFSGRLSQPLPWTVTVVGASGKLVASSSGTGDRISWRWNSAGLRTGRYVWTMEAGPDVRPARGVVGGQLLPDAPKPQLLSAVVVTPAAVSPNGDGFADSAAVSYVLGGKARVTVAISDIFGLPAAVLFSDQRQTAGAKSFSWPLDELADGSYKVTVTARTDGGRTAKADRAISVSRVLGWVRADPLSFSPDGDGIGETITFSLMLTEAAQVAIEVRRQGAAVASVFSGPLEPGTHAFIWDGRLATGIVSAGGYEVWVTAAGPHGNAAQSAAFDVTGRPG